MTEIIIGEDCGNSPKNILLRDLAIAFAKGDKQFTLSNVTADIQWNCVGQKLIRGGVDFAEELEKQKYDRVAEIMIQHVVTHGRAGAVNGTRKMENGKIQAFCDVVEFNNAKGSSVKEITSYMLYIS